jgi:hypothetical protein
MGETERGEDMRQSLLAFDTDRIKEYVFATDVLKEIRGASNILDTLNRQEMPRCVSGTCYYAHGGAGLFVVATDDATACIRRVRQVYAEKTGGAVTITGVEIPLPDHFDTAHHNIQTLWKHLGYKLKAAKARNPAVRTSVTHPLLHFGHADGTFYATDIDDEEGTLISTASTLKRQRNDEIRQQARQKGQPLAEDFDTIAAASLPSNYFALLYADGDGLGQALEACTTLPEIRRVATGIDSILQRVKTEALEQHGVASNQADTLLHGGDDLILAVPAHKALDIALYINDGFQRQTQQRLGTAYTLSIAIVWAHATFPFGTWLDIAESTLKFAKREGAKRSHKGLLNFLAISSANHLDFKQFYQQVLTNDAAAEYRIIRTLRPYTNEGLRQLIAYRHMLQRVPRNKLAALRQAVFQPRTQAIFEAFRVLVHWRGERTRQTIQELVNALVQQHTGQIGSRLFPFVEVKDDVGEVQERITTYYTPIVDLAELWDFIPGGIDEE